MALSVSRYLLRAQHRATPFGLFAGVTTVAFGSQARAEWGKAHVAVGRAGAEWLAAVVERLESCPELLDQLPVVVNDTVMSRGTGSSCRSNPIRMTTGCARSRHPWL